MKKQYVLLLVLVFLGLNAFSQEKINFYGKITSRTGFVFNATILNTKLKTGTVSSIEGDFSMPVSKNDTIAFSCIGYKSFVYVIPDSLQNTDYRVLISMVEDTVMLKETIVMPWPVNKTALKRAFLDNKNTEKEIIASYAGFREIDRPQREPEPTFMNPVSLIAKLFSRKRIAKAKTERIRRLLRKAKEE